MPFYFSVLPARVATLLSLLTWNLCFRSMLATESRSFLSTPAALRGYDLSSTRLDALSSSTTYSSLTSSTFGSSTISVSSPALSTAKHIPLSTSQVSTTAVSGPGTVSTTARHVTVLSTSVVKPTGKKCKYLTGLRTPSSSPVLLKPNRTTWPFIGNSSTSVVFYNSTFPAEYPNSLRQKIEWLMNYFETLLPVRFQKVNSSSPLREDLALQFRVGHRCGSTEGFRNVSERNFIELHTEVCDFYPELVHEFLHMLGLKHEHTRQDRDTVITIQPVATLYDFTKRDCDLIMSEPYDLTSMMHYDAELPSFNRNQYVYTVNDISLRLLSITRRVLPSHCDWMRLRYLYPDKDPDSKLFTKPVRELTHLSSSSFCDPNCLSADLKPTKLCYTLFTAEECTTLCLLDPGALFQYGFCTWNVTVSGKFPSGAADSCVPFKNLKGDLEELRRKEVEVVNAYIYSTATSTQTPPSTQTAPSTRTAPANAVPEDVKRVVQRWCEQWTVDSLVAQFRQKCINTCVKCALGYFEQHQRYPSQSSVVKVVRKAAPLCHPPSSGKERRVTKSSSLPPSNSQVTNLGCTLKEAVVPTLVCYFLIFLLRSL